jgi:hypothetical protein
MRLFFVALLASMTYSSAVFAAAGTSWAAKEDYKNPKNEMGLCTQSSSEQLFMKTGYCQSIMDLTKYKDQYCPPGCNSSAGSLEQSKKSPESLCPAALFEVFRKRVALTYPGQNAPQSADSDLAIDFPNCSEGRQGGRDMSTLVKDQQRFAQAFAVWMSTIVIETSDWDREASSGLGEGLLGLSRKDMEDKKYRCGCELKNPPDPLPGPQDGHHSMSCGTYMALVNIVKDGTLGGGKNKKNQTSTTNSSAPNKDTREGAAKLFKVLEDVDGNDKQGQKLQERMQKKFETYCKNSAYTTSTPKNMDSDSDAGGRNGRWNPGETFR